ncbi:AAA family ATPase [Hazenella sp. IB182357]|uniref:AAA family ATPase n=1 Tax=Polycladospora coralii TaxID=2771432 RepID=A0A926N9T2_9BACL|nr:AAA domain-containing protein [Polycladospora coralii]MBD1372831.1 AAA family ATPase [Polycladospora coralii]
MDIHNFILKKNRDNQLRYYRRSLIDDNILDFKWSIKQGLHPLFEEVSKGQLNAGNIQSFNEKKRDFKGSVDLFVCPWVYQYQGKYVTPIFIPAKIDQLGKLKPIDDYPPYILRKYLRPTLNGEIEIGDVKAFDKYIEKRPYTPNNKWSYAWRYAESMYKEIAGRSMNKFAFDGFSKTNSSWIVIRDEDKLKGSPQQDYAHIYEDLIKSPKHPKLLSNFLSTKPTKKKRLRIETENVHSHVGQMNKEHALSDDQRESLYHLFTLNEGDTLAINGPPGTGKTTLIQNIVASYWTNAALQKGDPPIYFCTSHTNKAIMNIIDSFAKSNTAPQVSKINKFIDQTVFEKLQGRWIKDINSFALCFPAAKQIESYHVNGYQMISAKHHFMEDMERKLVTHERMFLNKCQEYFNEPISNVENAIRRIHKELKRFNRILKRGSHYILRSHQIKTMQSYKQNNPEPKDCPTSLYIMSKCLSEDLLVKMDKQLELKLQNYLDTQFEDVVITKEIPIWKFALEEFDKSIRYIMFSLATHYWEARWLMEVKSNKPQKNAKRKYIETKEELMQQYKRYAMITPCLVGTFYKLEGKMKVRKKRKQTNTKTKKVFESDYLFDFFDLLIMDEASQVSPQMAVPALAFAKKAIVIGDENQLEPIVKGLSYSIDIGNLKSNLKQYRNPKKMEKLEKNGFLASTGSAIEKAQYVSKYQKFPPYGGMYLFHHRRSVIDIMDYINQLAYRGILVNKRERTSRYSELFQYAMGYIHIDSKVTRNDAGIFNVAEAEQMVYWLQDNRDKILQRSGKNNLRDVLAVITPFKYQSVLIKELLNSVNFPDDIIVNTVHALQGDEKDIILFSPTDTRSNITPFFDRSHQLMNVAVSRARDHFILFTNWDKFGVNQGEPSRMLRERMNHHQIDDLSVKKYNEGELLRSFINNQETPKNVIIQNMRNIYFNNIGSATYVEGDHIENRNEAE